MKILPNVLLPLTILTTAEVSSFDSPSLPKRIILRSLVAPLFGSRREQKTQEEKIEYERRRNLWLDRYGSVGALQKTFGEAPIFGDLTPEQTRKFYHTLLPRSLLGLYEMGLMKPEELAPLAYSARIAAKEYARSRCIWTGRLMTAAFDLYRGRLGKPSSMSWEELYKKYEAQIVEEVCSDEWTNQLPSSCSADDDDDDSKTDDEEADDLTMRIYLRILERSCSTNQAFDALFLTDDDDDDDYLRDIASKLERDVRFLLLSSNNQEKAEEFEKELQKAEEKESKKKRKLEKKGLKKKRKERQRKIRQEQQKTKKEVEEVIENIKETGIASIQHDQDNKAHKKWRILRILAGTRRRVPNTEQVEKQAKNNR